jgi:hypothetical protein
MLFKIEPIILQEILPSRYCSHVINAVKEHTKGLLCFRIICFAGKYPDGLVTKRENKKYI